MKNTKHILSLLIFSGAIISSCKKEDAKPMPDIFYTVSIDGFTVTFQNQTKNAASYKWDFGDGSESTEENPSHTYAHKGKFVPTLYATSADGTTAEGSTVLYISKASSVKLDDNSFNDWDTVTHNVVISGASAGEYIKAKYDYDGENIYFYYEMNTSQSNGDIFDYYIDADNNPATGYITGTFPNGGYDVLLEGTLLDGWLDVYYHNGAQVDFAYDYQNISEFFLVGNIEESGGVLKFEGAFKRSKLKGLTGKALRIAVIANANDWSSEVGYTPDSGTDAFYLDMSE